MNKEKRENMIKSLVFLRDYCNTTGQLLLNPNCIDVSDRLANIKEYAIEMDIIYNKLEANNEFKTTNNC